MNKAWLLAVPLALSCACGPETLDSRACPANAGALTYESFGKPFLDRWCNGCHAAASPNRNGAPSAVVFDTPDDVQQWKARIFALAADDNDSMPPNLDGPPPDDRRRLGDWLACGAK